MSSHKANTNKPCSLKCRHFCFPFNLHNYHPTCREAGRGDDTCVTGQKSGPFRSSFTDKQLCTIKNRKCYTKKHKSDSSRDELDLFGDPQIEEVFSGSDKDLEQNAQQLYSLPPRNPALRLGDVVN